MLNHLKNATNVAYTENGARAFKTTKSSLVDLFAQGGAMRNRSEQDKIDAFVKAFSEDELLAMKMLFYFRDIRGGQGERNFFKTIVQYMANNHTAVMAKNLHLIPEFGRWDDVYVLFGTKLEKQAGEMIKTQFAIDIVSEHPSLLGKWLKSENASSLETKKLATKTRKILGLSERQYRKSLSKLRKQINVVERLMSSKQWDKIEYDKLTSKAGLQYRGAFYRNDEERYTAFIDSLQKGEKKINAGTLYPYELVEKVYYHNDDILDQMWKALPDYIGDKQEDSLVVVDVSPSMNGRPMQMSISVGLYMAERNKGLFHNHFITFSTEPQLVQVKGKHFCEKVRHIRQANWGGSTNVKAVFDLILNTAIQNRLPQSEMVKKVYIVSDMEFDQADRNANEALFRVIKQRYAQAGYEMPNLVFWNVNARNEQFPMTIDDSGVQLVSGASPSIFTSLMKGEFVTPYELMLDVLSNERYNVVTV